MWGVNELLQKEPSFFRIRNRSGNQFKLVD